MFRVSCEMQIVLDFEEDLPNTCVGQQEVQTRSNATSRPHSRIPLHATKRQQGGQTKKDHALYISGFLFYLYILLFINESVSLDLSGECSFVRMDG